MSARGKAVQVFGRLMAQGLANAGECLDALCTGCGAPARGAAAGQLAAAAAAASVAREAAALAARRRLWPLVEAGAARAALLAAAFAAGGGLLLGAECEAIARELVGARLRRRGARHAG